MVPLYGRAGRLTAQKRPISLAPHKYKPTGAPNIAMQSVLRGWSTPHDPEDPLSCKYTDLCAQIYPGGPDNAGRPGITTQFPFDNTSAPDWKVKSTGSAQNSQVGLAV
jgi:hypothetical protein